MEKSPYPQAKKEYNKRYAKEKIKRVPLDVSLEFYDTLKTTAEQSNESINGYIKKAIAERIERDNQSSEMESR